MTRKNWYDIIEATNKKEGHKKAENRLLSSRDWFSFFNVAGGKIMKKYITKYRFYPSWLFFLQDKWLMNQAQNGLKLIDYGIFRYVFIQSIPQKTIYFSYTGLGGSRKGEAKYDLRLRHPFLEKNYGKSPKKSRLNSNVRKKHRKVIIEIAPEKATYAYDELVHDRNKWHCLAWVRIFLMILLGTLIIIFMLFIENK